MQDLIRIEIAKCFVPRDKTFASLLPCELCAKQKSSRGWEFSSADAGVFTNHQSRKIFAGTKSTSLFIIFYSLFAVSFLSSTVESMGYNKISKELKIENVGTNSTSLFLILNSLFFI